jgi:hypothetical protein
MVSASVVACPADSTQTFGPQVESDFGEPSR